MSTTALTAEDVARYAFREALAAKMEDPGADGAPRSILAPAALVGDGEIPLHDRIKVAERALGEWGLDVHEPPGPNWQRIDAYIRGAEGLGWPSAALAGSKDSREYTRDGQFQWCGAFAAWAWGLKLTAAIRRHHLASTYRLHVWSAETARRLKPEELTPGDIAVVGPVGPKTKAWGAHVVLVTAPPRIHKGSLSVETVEGNAVGRGPGGGRFQGVIRHVRPFGSPEPKVYRVLFGVRPLLADCPP
jgi:hypothetical protein